MATLIQNVIKKMKQEGFVRYINNKFLDGLDAEITVAQGSGSGSAPMYIAYATSAQGLNFTLNPTANQAANYEYIAFKTHAGSTPPTKNDFADKWFNRKGIAGTPGEDGTNGTNAEQPGFRYNYSNNTDETKPGSGIIKFNNANPGSASEMYLDAEIVSGLSIASVISQFPVGLTIMIRPNNTTSSAFAAFKVTIVPSLSDDWFTIGISPLVMSATAFAPGDELCLQFYGGGSGSGSVTEAAILLAGNFARFAANGAGGYDLKDNAGNTIKSVGNVFRLSQFTSLTGVTDLPAANTFPHGAVVRLHESCLVGAGANPLGIMLQADANNNKWRPYGRPFLFLKTFGPLTAPTCSLTASGEFNLGTPPEIPANLLNADSRLAFHLKYRKIGATQPIMQMWFGTNVARTSNSKIYTYTLTTTANNDNVARAELDFLTSTTARSSSRTPVGGTGAAVGFLDCTTALNIATKMYLGVDVLSLASDQVDVLEFGIAWER